MPKAVKISEHPELDPTLPKTEIKIGKETYYLCFSFKALAIAQKSLRDVGVNVNLLHALDLSNIDAEKLPPLLYAALITHHPKMTPAAAADLVTFKTLGTIFDGIANAYGASLADPSDEDVKADPGQAE